MSQQRNSQHPFRFEGLHVGVLVRTGASQIIHWANGSLRGAIRQNETTDNSSDKFQLSLDSYPGCLAS